MQGWFFSHAVAEMLQVKLNVRFEAQGTCLVWSVITCCVSFRQITYWNRSCLLGKTRTGFLWGLNEIQFVSALSKFSNAKRSNWSDCLMLSIAEGGLYCRAWPDVADVPLRASSLIQGRKINVLSVIHNCKTPYRFECYNNILGEKDNDTDCSKIHII